MLNVCKVLSYVMVLSLTQLLQGDLSGKLGFEEFKALWLDLRKWKAVFKQFDKDNSGRLNTYELRNAFHASGKETIFFMISQCVFFCFSFCLLGHSGDQGPVVQSIVSLTTSLRCQLVKYMLTKLSNTRSFFVGKM